MKYLEVNFRISCPEESLMQDARDVLAAMAGDAGFETFEETEEGLKGYVQQELFEPDVLEAVLEEFPFEGVSISYEIHEAEYQDWNAAWEAEGFEPITVGNGQIVVHDGRHLPEMPANISIEIDAKLAFGTGNHETTRMMLSALSTLYSLPSTIHHPLGSSALLCKEPSTILDCGTGTGILAIAALKLGAKKAVGYDIDEWSVDNARHNAVINRVDERFTPLLGDATLLDSMDETFDVVMANINRNILLNDLPRFVQKMHEGSTLLLSGFYEDDMLQLIDKAKELGLTLVRKSTENKWGCLVFN